MAKLSILAGATSQSVNIFIQNSSSTTGAGLTGLVFNSGSLIAYYTFSGANCTATAITLATLAAVNSAYSSGGFKEIDSTHMPGLYRLDIPNAALAAASGQSVIIMLSGATNMAPLVLEIELTAWNNQDGVHGGLSALPNTAVTTNASLLTSGTGTDQLSVTSGRIDVGKILGTASAGQAGSVGIDWAQVANKTSTVALTATTISTGQTITSVSGSVGSVTGAVGSVTGAVGSVTGNVGGSVASVTGNVGGSVASVTGNVGGSVASVGAGGITSSTLASGTITTASIAAGALTGATLGTDFATVFAADAITEAYSTKGGGLTIAKCLYDLHQLFYEMNITVTTQTVLKRDQATTAKTLTLNSATTPTAITEAS